MFLLGPGSGDDVPVCFDVVAVLFAEADAVVFYLLAFAHG